MSAGVAAIFKREFGKPTDNNDRLHSHLAHQTIKHGGVVYSLITKPQYYEKPSTTDYDIAFRKFTLDFKKRGYKTLVCSAMRCVRDETTLEHFLANLKTFQNMTKAEIKIVTYSQLSVRKLWSGQTHDEFLNKLNYLITSNSLLLPHKNIYKDPTPANKKTALSSKPETDTIDLLNTTSPFYGFTSSEINKRTVCGSQDDTIYSEGITPVTRKLDGLQNFQFINHNTSHLTPHNTVLHNIQHSTPNTQPLKPHHTILQCTQLTEILMTPLHQQMTIMTLSAWPHLVTCDSPFSNSSPVFSCEVLKQSSVNSNDNVLSSPEDCSKIDTSLYSNVNSGCSINLVTSKPALNSSHSKKDRFKYTVSQTRL